jgi:hypothetical protein
MISINTEDVFAFQKDGKCHEFTGTLPDGVNFNDLITREDVEGSDTLYFDDFTGEQITA